MATRVGAGIVLLLLSGAAGAQVRPPLPNVGPPLILVLEGAVEPSAAAARGKGFTTVTLAFAGSDARGWLAVDKARTVGGDQPLDGKDVLNVVAPFNPNLLVTGPDAMVSRVRDAPPGTKIHVEGLVDTSARTYYLRRADAPAS